MSACPHDGATERSIQLPQKIDSDHSRFRQIIRGKIKKNLKKYMSSSELIGRQGKKYVSIPIPQIELPKFKYGRKEMGGVGQGKGEVGQPLGAEPEEGSGEAGNTPGKHLLEMDITIEELAEIMGEELELPRIEPKGKKNINVNKMRYTGINRSGPEALRHFKRTYKEALKRQILSGGYNADDPIVVPIKEDTRYRSWKVESMPESNAVIIYMMDVSGSMGEEQKELVRIESFWIDTWIKSQYKGVDRRFIIHDATAREVDEKTFFYTKESGGTIISSAYKLAMDIIQGSYTPADWNIYLFHFSDGDNWSGDDTNLCMELLKQQLIPSANLFCYGQVESKYGSGQFYNDVHRHFSDDVRVAISRIENKEKIFQSIKTFLGKGR
jgi:sporulation protein YhbH